MSGERILVVDDDPAIVSTCIRTLTEEGFRVRGVGSGEEALACLREEPFDLFLTDVQMPDMDGLTLLRRVRDIDSNLTAVVITGHGTLRNAIDALRAGARGFLVKPFELDDLLSAVDEALEERRREHENIRLRVLLPILEISQALMAEGDVESLAGQLLEVVVQQIGADRASLMLLDQETDELYVAGAVGLPAKAMDETRIPAGQRIAGQALLGQEPLMLDGKTKLAPALRALTGQPEIAVSVCLPLRISKKAVGVLSLGRLPGSPPFTSSDVDLLSIVGSQIATALDNARLYEAVTRRSRELTMINLAGQAFNSTLDPDNVLIVVLEEVRRLLDVVACSVWLLDAQTGELVCRQAVGPQSEMMHGWRLAPGEGLAGWVAYNGESLIVPDAMTDERHFKDIDRLTGLALRSIIGVALRVHDSVIGVLQVVDTQVNRFSSTDLTLIESLATAAAIAIENARLYAETDRLRAFNENIVQGMEEGILLEDEAGRITFVNPRTAELLGYAPQELVGLPWTAVAAPEYVAKAEEESAKRPQGIGGRYEGVLLTKAGQRVPVIVSARPLFQDGRFAGVLSVFTDITERKRTEEALKESERRYRDLFENAPLCILEIDLEQTPPAIVRANRQAERVFGWTSKEFAALSPQEIVLPEAVSDLERMVTALEAGETITLETVGRRRDGTVFPIRASSAVGTMSGLNQAVVVIEDIAAEKDRRSEEEAIAEERRRIAREIHDGLAQDLASLRLKVGLWHTLVDHNPAQMHAELDDLRDLLGQEIREVRRSIFALRPVALDELGFFPALYQFVGDFGEQNQLHIDLHVVGPKDRLLPSLEPVLFRIVQETLNNVGKHARASTVWIELDLRAADSVALEVRDDGVGFDPTTLEQAVRHGHLGLRQMRERVEGLGGTLELKSQAQKGTEIHVDLPVQKP